MTDITVIILTKNEEKNIVSAINSAKNIAQRIVVVDCGSTDSTTDLARELNAEVYVHEWEGHAKQFNWALDNCDITTQWVFRLDADERISEELASEIKNIPNECDYDGFEMRWRVYFMGKWIKHGGTHKPFFLRLFKHSKGRVVEQIMDEHVIVNGNVGKLKGDLIHFDYKGLDEWLKKHIWYSNLELSLYNNQSSKIEKKEQRAKRSFYYRLPLFFRVRLYFLYRYIFQLGFLDGTEGRIFIYLQSYWYRFLVDAKIFEERHHQ